jgi:hypothetical protein
MISLSYNTNFYTNVFVAGDMWVLAKHLYSLHHTDTAVNNFALNYINITYNQNIHILMDLKGYHYLLLLTRTREKQNDVKYWGHWNIYHNEHTSPDSRRKYGSSSRYSCLGFLIVLSWKASFKARLHVQKSIWKPSFNVAFFLQQFHIFKH